MNAPAIEAVGLTVSYGSVNARDRVDASMAEFEAVYARMGVAFDVVHGESFYRNDLEAMIDDLCSRGVAIEEEPGGAVVVPFTPEDGKGLEFIARKDGGRTA